MNSTPVKQNDPPQPPVLTINVSPIATSRGYLYLRRDAFFSDTVNVSVGNNGLLSSSETASVQQVTAILTELAQTAAAVLKPEFKGLPAAPTGDRARCASTITELIKDAPYLTTLDAFENIPYGGRTFRVYPQRPSPTDSVQISLRVKPTVRSSGQVRIGPEHPGLVAFFPVPALVALVCFVDHKADAPILLTMPQIINLYTESHFLDPQRDFLTNPQDSITFTAGFITGHKHVNQSAAKTIVDTVTAPIRALFPSVSVVQTTQVQSGGGKPDQTTTTTQTTTSPPKGP